MEQRPRAATALEQRSSKAPTPGRSLPSRPERSIRPRRPAGREVPIFVDRGRRRLATLTVAVLCIAALGLWWVMLVLAFADGTSGSDPRLIDRGGVEQPADGTDAVNGTDAVDGPWR